MHESIFTYSLTRPYPFKWFTPLVLVGGSVLLVLVTFLSMATSGYETAATYSYDPNITESQHTVFSSWPSFMTANTKASCQSTTIPIGSSIYTNNTAFSYTVTEIWQGDDADQLLRLGSLPYHNNRLRNCSVRGITMSLESTERTALQIAKSNWGALLRAFLTCSIDSPRGTMKLNMTTTWDYNPPDRTFDKSSPQFSNINQSYASLWWGKSLMAWQSLAFVNETAQLGTRWGVNKGYITMSRPLGLVTNEQSIEGLNFLSGSSYFFNGTNAHPTDPLLVSKLVLEAAKRDFWFAADTLSKAMYFTVLADLGQKDVDRPNILESTGMLEYFTQNITNISREMAANATSLGLDKSNLARRPFDPANPSDGPLGVQPSVLSAVYLCQQPRLKQGGSLVMAILVADLVLLQLIWKAFKFTIDSIYPWKKDNPQMEYCKGCAVQAEAMDFQNQISTRPLSSLSRKPKHARSETPLLVSDGDNP